MGSSGATIKKGLELCIVIDWLLKVIYGYERLTFVMYND